jgi:hypothetical protein
MEKMEVVAPMAKANIAMASAANARFRFKTAGLIAGTLLLVVESDLAFLPVPRIA